MTTFAISMVRDEADIVEQTVGWMATQVDHVIVADNGSKDGTREILEGLGVEVVDDPEVGYYQSEKMTRLAHIAANRGARWVIPFDADELWYSPFGQIADALENRREAAVAAPVFDHVASGIDPEGPPVEAIGWRRREQIPLPKMAVRPLLPVRIWQGNHGADWADGGEEGQDNGLGIVPGLLVVRHYPYRSAEQMVRKARNGAQAYAATDLPEEVGKHWRDYGRLSDEQIAETFYKWFWVQDPRVEPGYIYDPAPCQIPASR